MNKKQFDDLTDSLASQYRAMVRGMPEPGTGGKKPGFSKKRLDDLCAGFSDGQSTLLKALKDAGALKVD